jgi:hypothetical protein
MDRVPIAEALGHSAPLAAMLGHLQDRVQNLQVGQTDIASLARKAILDLLVPRSGDFHTRTAVEKSS